MRKTESMYGQYVVGRGPRGERIFGKVENVLGHKATLRYKDGPRDTTVRRVNGINTRKAVPIPKEIPNFLLRGRKAKDVQL